MSGPGAYFGAQDKGIQLRWKLNKAGINGYKRGTVNYSKQTIAHIAGCCFDHSGTYSGSLGVDVPLEAKIALHRQK